ncbi:hypothetical protein E2C01_010794 [Portunus trituberculatus]|uniref:Uncharacterized protein n=1 Tax=Portunus trituberculatus TaxID=210409 RepID=A0A5B7D9D3_PORTR|nr:hypothetical protein [Portunus trituberculatus]
MVMVPCIPYQETLKADSEERTASRCLRATLDTHRPAAPDTDAVAGRCGVSGSLATLNQSNLVLVGGTG